MDWFSAGKRVELVFCRDPHTHLEPGLKGTILFIDDLGTVHVRWDNGSQLGLIPNIDQWKEISE